MGKKNTPGNREIIVSHVEETYGISYTSDGIGKLLQRHGLQRLRSKLIPGKPPELEEQVKFILRYQQLREFEQLDSGVIQFFIDGMHLVHQVIPDTYWGDPKAPLVLNTNTSRKRLNILGAYHQSTQNFIHLTSEANCDAEQVIRFLEHIEHQCPQHHSVILHTDNAPYFHAEIVQQWLGQHSKIILNHLPTYSPNLNLIERLWRLVKKKLVRNRYYEKYKTFRAKVFQLLNHLDQYQDELDSLITNNFELVGQF